MIKIKTGVAPRNLIIAAAIANVAEELKMTLWITSGIDGAHMVGSKHYIGEALDMRRSNLVGKEDFVIDKIQKRLGKNYQIILEKTHIHIEYDPNV